MSTFELYNVWATSSYYVAPELMDHFAIPLGITLKRSLISIYIMHICKRSKMIISWILLMIKELGFLAFWYP